MPTATHAAPTPYTPPAVAEQHDTYAHHMATGTPFPPSLRVTLPTAPAFVSAQEGMAWILGGP